MITIAVPKGSLFNKALDLLDQIGIHVTDRESIKRKLTFFDDSGAYKFILVRNMDVPPYVEHGAADVGFVGKDIIEESHSDVSELVDLDFGYCRLAIAALKEDNVKEKGITPNMRVATKFVNCTENYFRSKDLDVEIIKLYGSIELAPIVGLSDVIVDLVATGTTLKENGLEEIDTIFETTARFVANRVSLKTNYQQIKDISMKLKELVAKK